MLNVCIELATSLACSLDPVEFHRRYLRAELPELDAWQVKALHDRSPNMLLLCGRQTGKSTLAALLACWQAIEWPGQLILLLSPTLRQSSELFRKTRMLVDAVPIKPREKRRTSTELELANGSKIVSLPGSNPDAIRGYSRPDLIIEDESAFVHDRTFAAVRPMLAASANPRHILMSTPYGRRGHFYELWRKQAPDWSRLSIRSDECPRITAEFLEGERRVLSDRAYRQEYCCEFLEAAMSVFPADVVERLVDDNKRREELPDKQESDAARDRQRRIKAATSPDEVLGLAQETGLADNSGYMKLDRLMIGPGPWGTLDDVRSSSTVDPTKTHSSKLLREFCRLNNERSNLLGQDPLPASRAARIAEIDQRIAKLRADPDFPSDSVKPA